MSLADKISDLLSTTPASFDPEDDVISEDTAAKVTERDVDDNETEIPPSKYSKRNIDLLENVDVKYAGKRSSRKNLAHWVNDDFSDGPDEFASDEDDGSVDSDGTDVTPESSVQEEKNEITYDNIIDVHDFDTKNEVKKGLCVRNQLSIWENLLEIRIQLQKCLLVANKMPQETTFTTIKNQSGEAFTTRVTETRKNIVNTLEKLLHLQKCLLKQHPETKSLLCTAVNDDDDGEVLSDTDNDAKIESDSSDDEEPERSKNKKRKLTNYKKTIAVNHEKYRDYRNSVIQKWYDKTRVGTATKGARNNTITHSVLDQIEYHLTETKDKLRKRTQMKRSEYEILGSQSNEADEYNPEIFDDSDFYHQLLKELIEVKSADVTDPVQLAQQWIRLQSLRSKMKRKIDTKATKGRKIRYAVHTKLVNFMAPIDDNSWKDEARAELFSSLFGKNQSICVMQLSQ